jgi:hypothetical protein
METIMTIASNYGFWSIPFIVIIYILINSRIVIRYPRSNKEDDNV